MSPSLESYVQTILYPNSTVTIETTVVQDTTTLDLSNNLSTDVWSVNDYGKHNPQHHEITTIPRRQCVIVTPCLLDGKYNRFLIPTDTSVSTKTTTPPLGPMTKTTKLLHSPLPLIPTYHSPRGLMTKTTTPPLGHMTKTTTPPLGTPLKNDIGREMSHVTPNLGLGNMLRCNLSVNCSTTVIRTTMIVSYTSVVVSTTVSKPPGSFWYTQMPLSECHPIF